VYRLLPSPRQAVPLVLVTCAAVSAGFGIYLAHAAANIHHCNTMDLEPCLSGFSFRFTLMMSIGIVVGLIPVSFAVVVLSRQRRHGDRSPLAATGACLVLVSGAALGIVVVVSAHRSQAIYPYNDPSDWMYAGAIALAGAAALLLSALALETGRSS
jgi:hypothetical protein